MKKLNNLKEKLSKIRKIYHKNLKMAKYLELDNDINTEEAKGIFQFREVSKTVHHMSDMTDHHI